MHRTVSSYSRAARGCAAVLLIVLFIAQVPAGAWGEEGHIWINEVAAARLPMSMPAFLREAKLRLGYLGPEPDRWRNQNSEPALKYSQEPDHFIDLERIPADFGELPRDRYLYMRKLFEARAAALAAGIDKKKADELLPDKVGLQPYIVMEVMDRLRVAFREYRQLRAEGKNTYGVQQNIIFYAGWLGHYVADGSQPLHTTVNYNGWVTSPNPNGYTTDKNVHWDFESRFVRENIKPASFAALVKTAEVLQDPWKDYLAYLNHSNSLVEEFYRLEKAGAFAGKGTTEGQKFTRERLAAGAKMLADMWYTTWVQSAVTPPDPYAPKTPRQKPTAAKTQSGTSKK